MVACCSFSLPALTYARWLGSRSGCIACSGHVVFQVKADLANRRKEMKDVVPDLPDKPAVLDSKAFMERKVPTYKLDTPGKTPRQLLEVTRRSRVSIGWKIEYHR